MYKLTKKHRSVHDDFRRCQILNRVPILKLETAIMAKMPQMVVKY